MSKNKARQPKRANAEGTLIDLLLDHPVFGEIPFTASPDDVEAHGRELFAQAAQEAFGTVADYEPPKAPTKAPAKPALVQ